MNKRVHNHRRCAYYGTPSMVVEQNTILNPGPQALDFLGKKKKRERERKEKGKKKEERIFNNFGMTTESDGKHQISGSCNSHKLRVGRHNLFKAIFHCFDKHLN